ncbi:MAG TPA: hypothetical protein VFR58_02975, partial [Flavisolibacter sp.]|nr:hypothetical protein [Flavisolibacter sp.]
MAPEKEQPEARKKSGGNGGLNALLWIVVIAGFAGALILYLSSVNIRLFRKASVSTGEEPEEPVTEDIFAIDYEKETGRAIQAGNFRLATRLLFLRTLKDLSNAGLIQYRQERTNSDYLLQLSGTSYYKDFFRLTRDFEYSWYGKFDVSDSAFKVIEQDFSQFKNALPR